MFLFFSQKVCCGCIKEPPRKEGPFAHRKHMFRLKDKKMVTIFVATLSLQSRHAFNVACIIMHIMHVTNTDQRHNETNI